MQKKSFVLNINVLAKAVNYILKYCFNIISRRMSTLTKLHLIGYLKEWQPRDPLNGAIQEVAPPPERC